MEWIEMMLQKPLELAHGPSCNEQSVLVQERGKNRTRLNSFRAVSTLGLYDRSPPLASLEGTGFTDIE
jgi:hypothetical protein